jgi:hypothetical protein
MTKERKYTRAPFTGLLAFTVLVSQGVPAWAADAGQPSNLDLSSTTRSVTLPGSTQTVIMQGGRAVQIGVGDTVTPAQAAAVAQVLNSGSQSLALGSLGNAVGGHFVVESQTALSGLNVPRQVTAIGDFTNNAIMNIGGNLTNAGAFYAVSTSAAQANAIINAINVNNMAGATLSSVIPAGGLPGFSNAINNLNLSVLAQNNLTNFGTISSAADLSLAAGNRMVNGAGAQVSANQAVNLTTASLTNAGTISAATNLNIASLTGNMVVNNVGGTLSAGNAINLSAPGGYQNIISLNGGNLLSETLNFNAGSGWVDGVADNVSGVVNISAGNAHFGATSTVRLGALNITADPTFWSSGDLVITNLTGGLNIGEAITLLATNDVVFDASAGAISLAATDGTNGKNITIVAGAALVQTGTSQQDSNIGHSQSQRCLDRGR